MLQVSTFRNLTLWNPQVGFTPWLGSASDMERDLIWSRTLDLLEARLVELSHGEYASATIMPTKKDVHGNYMNRRMCGNYRPINGKLSLISMPCLHLKRSLMLWDMRGFLVHLIFEQGTISCRFERRTRPRPHFGASTLTTRIVCINGSSCPLGWRTRLSSFNVWWIGS